MTRAFSFCEDLLRSCFCFKNLPYTQWVFAFFGFKFRLLLCGVFLWFRNGFFWAVCSLTREERRKRNVDGIVCWNFQGFCLWNSKKNMAARFLREDVNTGSGTIIFMIVLDWCVNMFSSIQAWPLNWCSLVLRSKRPNIKPNRIFNMRVWSWLRTNAGGRLNTCKSSALF